MRVSPTQMRLLILLLLCSLVNSARVIKKVYAIGDTDCSGNPSIEPDFFVAEAQGTEPCNNLDTNNDGLNDASIRNRYCDQSYQKYHEEQFTEPGCVCLTGNCIREWQLGICTLIGQIPMIVECDQWQTQLPNPTTTVINITTHVKQNVTQNHIHHYNVTNVTRMVNESLNITYEIPKNVTITEQVWGISEPAFYYVTAMIVLGLGIVSYFIYATITKNKKEELLAAVEGMKYGTTSKLKRKKRIF